MSNYAPEKEDWNSLPGDSKGPRTVKCNQCFGTGEDRHGLGDCIQCAGFGDIEVWD